MPTIDERMAYLEGRVEGHSQGVSELREMVVHLDQKLDRFRDSVDRRFEGFEQRFDQIDRGIDSLEQKCERRFDAIDRRFGSTDQKLDQLQDRMGRQFQWTVGIQIAVMIAVVGALAAG